MGEKGGGTAEGGWRGEPRSRSCPGLVLMGGRRAASCEDGILIDKRLDKNNKRDGGDEEIGEELRPAQLM